MDSVAKESSDKAGCNRELMDLINYICLYCVEQIDQRTEKEFVVTYLRHLNKLIDCFDSNDISSDLLKTLECTCILEFFEKKLKRLIVDADDEKEIEIVLSLVFNLIQRQKYKEEVAFCNRLLEVTII